MYTVYLECSPSYFVALSSLMMYIEMRYCSFGPLCKRVVKFLTDIDDQNASIATHQIISLCNILFMMIYYTCFVEYDIALATNPEYLYYKHPTLSVMYTLQFVHHVQEMIFEPTAELGIDIWIHHAATVLLIVLSWYGEFRLGGAFVMYIHDVSDILIYLVRIVRTLDKSTYTKTAINPFAQHLQTALMPFLLVGWFYYRIHLFAYFIRDVYYNIIPMIDNVHMTQLSLLVALWCLHCFWFVMILKKCYHFIVHT
jgi:hypothetical protein